MKLNKTVKVLIGLATAVVVVSPLVILFGTLFIMFGMILGPLASAPTSNVPGSFFPAVFLMVALIFPIQIMVALIQIGLIAFYLIHIIKNTSASEVLRIILGVGLYLFPYLAMPAYYFLYVWPEQPPAWALENRVANQPKASETGN